MASGPGLLDSCTQCPNSFVIALLWGPTLGDLGRLSPVPMLEAVQQLIDSTPPPAPLAEPAPVESGPADPRTVSTSTGANPRMASPSAATAGSRCACNGAFGMDVTGVEEGRELNVARQNGAIIGDWIMGN